MNIAVEAVRAAARRVERFDRHRGDLRVRAKKPGDLVTSADLAAEEAVFAVLREHYPEAGILSEEAGQDGGVDDCWVLDPIDGTTNFVHGFPGYAVALAWCSGGRVRLGAIFDVARNDLYLAEHGRGAYCNDRRLRVAKTAGLADALLGATGGIRPEDWPLLAEASRRSCGCRRLGAGVLDFAMVARGALDACFGHGMHYWDYAAGMLLVQEAGGVFYPDISSEANEAPPFGHRLGMCLYGCPAVADELLAVARSSPAR